MRRKWYDDHRKFFLGRGLTYNPTKVYVYQVGTALALEGVEVQHFKDAQTRARKARGDKWYLSVLTKAELYDPDQLAGSQNKRNMIKTLMSAGAAVRVVTARQSPVKESGPTRSTRSTPSVGALGPHQVYAAATLARCIPTIATDGLGVVTYGLSCSETSFFEDPVT